MAHTAQTKARRQTLSRRLLRFGHKALISFIPRNRSGDRFFSYINFLIRHRRFPSEKLIFNDILYQIKTTDELLDPLRVFVSDKEFVKLYTKAVVGDQYNVPTIAVLESMSDVDEFSFPAQCCVKPTQASGSVILRRNGEPIDRSEIKRWFSINFYDSTREANYKTLKPKVIVEPLIFDNSNVEDYKFFCFDGDPRFIQVDIDRYSNHRRKFFDSEWNELDFSIAHPKATSTIVKPENFNEMLGVARALSQHFSLIRVDLYSNGEQLYVGELTNVHGNAGESFIPRSSEFTASKILFQTVLDKGAADGPAPPRP